MDTPTVGPALSGTVVSTTPPMIRLAMAAYLARFKGQSRVHTESDLRGYLEWCQQRDLDPLVATRPHLELYLRWLQEVRQFKPSTVSRRMSVVTGFYRTCVIDGVLEHSPAEYVRRPTVPAESPTLGLSHLQFEAMLVAAKQSTHECDFALVAMFGLLGLRIFEATGSNIGDLGEEHGHRVLRVHGKGDKIVLVPLPPAVGRAIERATGTRTAGPILLTSRGTRMDRHCATRRLRRLSEQAGVTIALMHPHMLRHTFVTTMLDAGVDLRDVQIAARHADPRTTMRYDRARKNLDRHPNYILVRLHGLRDLTTTGRTTHRSSGRADMSAVRLRFGRASLLRRLRRVRSDDEKARARVCEPGTGSSVPRRNRTILTAGQTDSLLDHSSGLPVVGHEEAHVGAAVPGAGAVAAGEAPHVPVMEDTSDIGNPGSGIGGAELPLPQSLSEWSDDALSYSASGASETHSSATDR